MSERSLIVRLGALEEIETALTDASRSIEQQITTLLAQVDAQIAGWDPATPSRAAEQAYQQQLRAGVARLTEALATVKIALAGVREDGRDTEVRNAALLD
ncbi:hypothetical protein [Actinotalea solisilvae]|uniref:hypothetical protein n=1 Tax=Actinotalea solisilvae TaxID=2072922 RepID=UPI0018F14511|nr:hypothetical protein [Actinotalea solisilvae]